MRNAPFERSLRRWANIWLVIVLLLAAWLGIRLSRGDAFETDLLSLLPPSSREPLVAESLRQFVKLSSDRLVFLVTDPSDFEAKEAAVHLADRLRASGFFSEIRDRFDGDYQAEIDRFFFPHRYALYGEARERSLVAPDAVAQMTQKIAEILSAPLSGSLAAHLDDDPLLFYPDFLRRAFASSSQLEIDDGFLSHAEEGAFSVVMFAQLRGSAFSRDIQQQVEPLLSASRTEILRGHPTVTIRSTGVLRYAADSAARAEREIWWISIGSIAGVVVLILGAYRSLRPLVLTSLTIAVACSVATAVSLLAFSKLHMITIGFGASLIGVGVDHGFHFFSHQSLTGERGVTTIRSIGRAISYGIATTILGYLGLLVAPFPGLQQIALFSIVGLTAAFLCVVLWYPFLSKVRAAPPDRLAYRLIARWLDVWRRWSVTARIVTGLVVLLSLAGLPFVKVGDDVRLLDRRSPELAADEAVIRETIGGFDTRTVFVVSGSTVDEVLQRDEILSSTLETLQREGSIRSFQALSQFVPSTSTQVRRRDALRSFLRSREEEIDAALQTLGFRSRSMEGLRDEASSTSHTNLELERFLSSTASLSVRHLWLGQVGGSYVALATVDGTNSAAQLDRLALPAGVFFSDAVAETSDILRTYRRHATLAIVGFYLLIFAFVIRRYGRIHGLLAFTPALLAALLSISMQGILAQPVNLFSVLSILIILGLGIDFTIFLLEGEDQENATMLAVILSGLSTLLSLALLAFCTSPVLQSFGHSLFFGTATAVLLSPIVLVAPRRHVQRRRRL